VASLLPSQKIVTWPGVEAVLKKPVWRPPEPEQIQGRRSSVHRMSSVSDMDNIPEAEEAPAPAQTQSQFLAGSSEDAQARAASVERAWLRATSCMRAPPKPAKKQGETISKGHKNHELMLNLQLGIRCAGQTIAMNLILSLPAAAIALTRNDHHELNLFGARAGMLWGGILRQTRWI
jgi:1-phosphatidylinositol-4-phosphate 5-kinase